MQKEMGIYFTPKYVADYIIEQCLKYYVDMHSSSDGLPNQIRLIDPACGDGAFFVSLKTVLDDFPLPLKRIEVTGFDLSQRNIDLADIKLSGMDFVDSNLTQKDFLKSKPKIPKYDLVVGNPPYVDIKTMDAETARFLAENFSTTHNRANLFSIFIEQALIWYLKPGGVMGFIVPNSLLYNSSYKKIRSLIMKCSHILEIVRLPDDVFLDARVETVIVILQKKNGEKPTSPKTTGKFLIFPADQQMERIDDAQAIKTGSLKTDLWKADKNNRFLLLKDDIWELLLALEAGTASLGEIGDICLGLTPYDKYKGHSPEQISNRVFHAESKLDESYKPLLTGSNIKRYSVNWSGEKYIRYGPWLAAPREQRFFTYPRIIVRQIISGKPPRIYAGFTDKEYYNTQIGFNVILKKSANVEPLYVLAILNSKLMTFYHKKRFLDETKRTFQKILIENARRLPIRIKGVDPALQQELVDCTSAIMDGSEEFEKIDQRIDSLVYEIYDVDTAAKKLIEREFA